MGNVKSQNFKLWKYYGENYYIPNSHTIGFQ